MDEVATEEMSKKENRIRQLKEDLRRQHAERLTGLQTRGGRLKDKGKNEEEDEGLSRYNKYWRSGADRDRERPGRDRERPGRDHGTRTETHSHSSTFMKAIAPASMGSSTSTYSSQRDQLVESRRRKTHRSEEEPKTESPPPQYPLSPSPYLLAQATQARASDPILNPDHKSFHIASAASHFSRFGAAVDDATHTTQNFTSELAQAQINLSRFSKPSYSYSGGDSDDDDESPVYSPVPVRSRWKHDGESRDGVKSVEFHSRLPIAPNSTARSSSILKTSSKSKERSITYSPISVRKLRNSKESSEDSDIGEDEDDPCFNLSLSPTNIPLPGSSNSTSTSPHHISSPVILKRPSIPLILRQPTYESYEEDKKMTRKARSRQREPEDSYAPVLKKKIPSILKKKDEDTQHVSGATVSFDLDELPTTSASSLIRTKSSDSNLSCDSETGYWSGDGVVTGILKNSRNRNGKSKDSDQKSILKPRRSSLGSSMVVSNTSDTDGLQGILKRKLSYDSSVLRCDGGHQYSLSTNSLPTSSGSLSPEPSSILKKKSSSEDLDDADPPLIPKPILKRSSLSSTSQLLSQEYNHSYIHSPETQYQTIHDNSSTTMNIPMKTVYPFEERDTEIRPILKKSVSRDRDREQTCSSNNSLSGENSWFSSFSNSSSTKPLRGGSILKGSSSDIDKCHSFESNQVFSSRSNSSLPDSFLNGSHHHQTGLGTSTHVTGRLSWGDLGGYKGSSVSPPPRYSPSPPAPPVPLRDYDIDDDDDSEFQQDFIGNSKLQKRRDSEPNYCSNHYGKSDGEFRAVTAITRTVVLPSGDQIHQIEADTMDLSGAAAAMERSESQEDIIMGLSVAEKRSLFMQMERESRRQPVAGRASPNSVGNRKKRFSTQPVTMVEVEEAAKMVTGFGVESEDESVSATNTNNAKRDISFTKNENNINATDSVTGKRAEFLQRQLLNPQQECGYEKMSSKKTSGGTISDYLEAAQVLKSSEIRGGSGRMSLGKTSITTPPSPPIPTLRNDSISLKGKGKAEKADIDGESLVQCESANLPEAVILKSPIPPRVPPRRRVTISHADVIGVTSSQMQNYSSDKYQTKRVQMEELKRPNPTPTARVVKDAGCSSGNREDFDPSKLSLLDRVRMFNGLATSTNTATNSAQSSPYRLQTKKLVISKRFITQPVTTLEHLQCQEYGPQNQSPNGRNDATVKDEEGQTCEVECVQIANAKTGDATSYSAVKAKSNAANVSVNVLITSSTKSAVASASRLKKEDIKQKSAAEAETESEVEVATETLHHLLDLSGRKNNSSQIAGTGPGSVAITLSKSLTSSLCTSTSATDKMPEKICYAGPEVELGLLVTGKSPRRNESLAIPSSDESSGNESAGSGSDGTNQTSFVKKRLSKSSSCTFVGMSDTGTEQAVLHTIKNSSIADKIAALKTNGEINWKRRLSDKIHATDQNDNLDLMKNNKDSILANRLSLLEKSQDGWKKRISENDATLFTVQGKLEKAGRVVERKDPPPVPILAAEKKLKGLKAPMRFRGKNAEVLDVSDGKSCSVKHEEILNDENNKNQMKREAAHKLCLKSSSSSCDSEEEKVLRSIAQNDNETFTHFFKSSLANPSASSSSGTVIDDISVFDAISSAGQLLGVRRNVKVNRKHRDVKNPVKLLASRIANASQTYMEISPEIREKELKKRVQIENLSKTSHLSIEALAGLASREDFTAVKLKKAKNEANKEFPHPMLICIKGKRFVQTRLIPPQVKSLSSGDCYILVTPNKIYQYIGEFSNRMEKSKLSDVVTHILQKKDVGAIANSQLVTIEEPVPFEGRDIQSFYNLLGGGSKPEVDHLGDEHDEAYEMDVIRTNRVFEMDSTKELAPLMDEGGWASQPKYSMLKEDRVLVFDFVTEMYVWSGSRADSSLKKAGFRMAKEMFEDTSSEIESLGGEKRPSWCWLKKINQHMEPILFIEKFFDWPDESGRVIKIQQTTRTSDFTDAGFNYQPCNVDEMILALENAENPQLELEGVDVCRASEECKDRKYTVTTTEVKSWHVSEFSKSEVETKSFGHFYSGETYVIRWQYRVTQVTRDLKGNTSRHAGGLGRERTAYFFWHGKDSRLTEQGTSALMTVELDQEKGPQVRVEQGREPSAFLALFKGLLFIHSGVSSIPKDSELYVAMGSVEDEGHVVEVSFEPSSFRSRGSFILIDTPRKTIYVWHGCLSNSTSRKIAQVAARRVKESRKEFKGVPVEMNEGDESKSFMESIDVSSLLKWRESYVSLAGRSEYKDVLVFRFSSLTGIFTALPVLCPKGKIGASNAFPILQEELYEAQQPSLFLISTGVEIWLWQGWTPRGDEENENTVTGSSEFRWAAERKAALETALSLCDKQSTCGFLINAGLEPALFQTIFPYWKTHIEAMETNLSEGKLVGAAEPIAVALEKFQKTTYTLEELQERPEGVDVSKLENYLSDEDFESLLKMSRDAFRKLQGWRQNELKKIAGLF